MEEFCLVMPSIEHEAEYKEMMLEWEKSKESIYPGSIRQKGLAYVNWLELLEAYKIDTTCPSPLVPSDTFFLVNEYKKIIGAISIRHYLNDQLLKFAGHIGYGIRPTEREKGYAKVMLKLALEKCKDKGLDRILITCDKDNIASSKTVIANGGILENELIEEDGNIFQRYWIEM